eukprot:TRINITY_DN28914_c0_g1_i1.p1 TRINITY_DN28914_c0_g1~~TRINITY_DN28914_c0_g1_i1.p1  ORF type:complete len:678 (-),score=84.64 TRINITY_DN28914_c0_g1_i1:369-2402(-)
MASPFFARLAKPTVAETDNDFQENQDPQNKTRWIERDESSGVPGWVYQEVGTLQVLRHPNILRLLGPVNFENDMCIMYPPLSVNLCAFRKEHGLFNDFELKRAACQLFDATAYMHDLGVYHRTLSTKCVLVDATIDRLLLSEFGDSVEHPFSRSKPPLVCDGWPNNSPEMLLGEVSTYSESDVWALGCIVAELATGKYTFWTGSRLGNIMKMFEVLGTPTEATWPGVSRLPFFCRLFPKFRGKGVTSMANPLKPFSEDVVALIGRILQCDPAQRPCCRAVLADPFFHGATIKPEVLTVASLFSSNQFTRGPKVSLKAAEAARRTWSREWCFGKDMSHRILSFLEGNTDITNASGGEDSSDMLLFNWLRSWLTRALSLPDQLSVPCGWLYTSTRRHLAPPSTALRCISASNREYCITRMMHCYHMCGVQDECLFHALMTFDRFCASESNRRDDIEKKINCVCAAACLMSLKLLPRQNMTSFDITERVVMAFSFAPEMLTMEDIADAELMILKSLDFEVNVPSVYTILQTLVAGISLPPLCLSLAEFLLRLSVSNIALHLNCRPTSLACAALVLSLQSSLTATERNVADDFGGCAFDFILDNDYVDAAAVEEVDRCTMALLRCWVQSAADISAKNRNASALVSNVYAMFHWSTNRLHRDAIAVEPPVAPLVLVTVLGRR